MTVRLSILPTLPRCANHLHTITSGSVTWRVFISPCRHVWNGHYTSWEQRFSWYHGETHMVTSPIYRTRSIISLDLPKISQDLTLNWAASSELLCNLPCLSLLSLCFHYACATYFVIFYFTDKIFRYTIRRPCFDVTTGVFMCGDYENGPKRRILRRLHPRYVF
jgi:hypothetical protein